MISFFFWLAGCTCDCLEPKSDFCHLISVPVGGYEACAGTEGWVQGPADVAVATSQLADWLGQTYEDDAEGWIAALDGCPVEAWTEETCAAFPPCMADAGYPLPSEWPGEGAEDYVCE